MQLSEFIQKEQELKDIALEILQKQKELSEIMQEHSDLFKFLKMESRRLGIKCIDGNFILS